MSLKLITSIICILFFVQVGAKDRNVDVLIIGGSASGTTAGIQSARLGVNTLIVEEFDWLGGMLTSSGVSAIDGNYNLRGGLFGEFVDSLSVHYGGLDNLKTGWVSNILFEPSVGADILRKMADREKNLTVWHKSKFISAEKQKRGWLVKIKKDNVISSIYTKVLIDATELGDVAKYCGVKYDVGMEARDVCGEKIAPEQANDIIQDLTYVMVLQDFGDEADKTIPRPANYDPSFFYCACKSNDCTNPKEGQKVWDCQSMLNYGKLPNNKYMINWPIEGNDYYVNMIEMDQDARKKAVEDAKEFSLCFLYYIQTELGYNNLGLAENEFDTEDNLPYIPYHRESRRIHGKVRFNVNYVSNPYDQAQKLYRTGIAVGDYPVDHHHARYTEWNKLPDLHFYPVPSYSVPLGVMIPEKVEDLIVMEKSISVSNLLNGSTRLQPVVMSLGQAGGVLAALSVKKRQSISDVSIRYVQSELLNANAYLYPYLDVPQDDAHFKALQRIGATGILKSEGRNEGWTNQTWIRADELLLKSELEPDLKEFGFKNITIASNGDTLTIGDAMSLINKLLQGIKKKEISESSFRKVWEQSQLGGLEDLEKAISRKEFAVMLDRIVDPFKMKEVNIIGELK